MLASTVQFSNNDQPPITPTLQWSSLGPASEGQPLGRTLRHPTACPALPSAPDPRSTLRRAVLAARVGRECRIVNVPPMS
jgi:hypothetical protein